MIRLESIAGNAVTIDINQILMLFSYNTLAATIDLATETIYVQEPVGDYERCSSPTTKRQVVQFKKANTFNIKQEIPIDDLPLKVTEMLHKRDIKNISKRMRNAN